ncbi:MAG: CRISPR-associated protein Cas5, partial [Nitrosotalea sp.]
MTQQKSEANQKNIHAVCITVMGDFNSYRISTNIKYQRSYTIPTKTTLIGMLGAALGMQNKELEILFKTIKTNAVLISLMGRAKDLWLVSKLKADGNHEKSPIIREVLVNPVYTIYYQADNDMLLKIIDALKDPKFVLSLGRSDEMIEIKEIHTLKLNETKGIASFKNTVIPFNYRSLFLAYESIPVQRGTTMELPEVINIPV